MIRASTRGVIVCSMRCASSCASAQSMPRMSTSSRSVSKCRRLIDSAASTPTGESVIALASSISTSPSRCMRRTVFQTVGADTPIFSVRRAAMTGRPARCMS